MKNDKNLIIVLGVGLIAIAVIAIACLYMQPTKKPITPVLQPPITQTTEEPDDEMEKIDEHLTMDKKAKNIEICDQEYMAKGLYIDGRDVSKNISRILEEEEMKKESILRKTVCTNMNFVNKPGDELEIVLSEPFDGSQTDTPEKQGQQVYNFWIGGQKYSVSVPNHIIFLEDPHGGWPIGPIGQLE